MKRRKLLEKAKEAVTGGTSDPVAPYEDESLRESIAGTLGDIKERVKEKREEQKRSKQFDQAVRERAREQAEQEFQKERREQLREQAKTQTKERLRRQSRLFDTDDDGRADVAVTRVEQPADRLGPSPMLDDQASDRPGVEATGVDLGPSPMLDDRQPQQTTTPPRGRRSGQQPTDPQPALPRDVGLAVLDSTAPVGLPEFGNDPVAEEFERAQNSPGDDPRGWDDLQW